MLRAAVFILTLLSIIRPVLIGAVSFTAMTLTVRITKKVTKKTKKNFKAALTVAPSTHSHTQNKANSPTKSWSTWYLQILGAALTEPSTEGAVGSIGGWQRS